MEPEALLDRLRALVTSVTAADGSPTYRRLYGMEGAGVKTIDSWDAWRSLPLLTKEYLQSIPLSERSFAPRHDLDAMYVSSGTTGKPPFFSVRTRIPGYEYRTALFRNPRAFLSAVGPPYRQQYWLSTLEKPAPVVALDPKRMDASVKLAAAAGVDGMFVFVHHIPLLAELMREHGIAEQMRYVEVTGEMCSDAMYRYLRKMFPHAVLVASFGATEIEDTPFAISGSDGEEALRTFTAKAGCFLELVDAETGTTLTPSTGVEGELLLTTYAEGGMAFPMIRYRIGDRVRVTSVGNGTWSFTSLGRANVDFIKIPGGILHADEIERVLTSVDSSLGERFEAHVYEHASSHGPVSEVVLHIDAQGYDTGILAARVAAELRIGPSFTYADGVKRGLYNKLSCVVSYVEKTAKKRRIVRHTSP